MLLASISKLNSHIFLCRLLQTCDEPSLLELDKDLEECGIFGEFYRDFDGTPSDEMQEFLQNSPIAKYCPCDDEKIQPYGDEAETQVDVCGSFKIHGFSAYRAYCSQEVPYLMKGNDEQDEYLDVRYEDAYHEFLQAIEELSENDVLTVEEIRAETESALVELDASLENQDETDYCMDGCIRFVQYVCCNDKMMEYYE